MDGSNQSPEFERAQNKDDQSGFKSNENTTDLHDRSIKAQGENDHEETSVNAADNEQPPVSLVDQRQDGYTDDPEFRTDSTYRADHSGVASRPGKRSTLFIIAIAVIVCIVLAGCVVLGRHFWAVNHPIINDGGFDISAVSSEDQSSLGRAFHGALPSSAEKSDSREKLMETTTKSTFFKVEKNLGARDVYFASVSTLGSTSTQMYLLYGGSVTFWSVGGEKAMRDGFMEKLFTEGMGQESANDYQRQATKISCKSLVMEASIYLAALAESSNGAIISNDQVSFISEDMSKKTKVSIDEDGKSKGDYHQVLSTGRYFINIDITIGKDIPLLMLNIVNRDAKYGWDYEKSGMPVFTDTAVRKVPRNPSRGSTAPKQGSRGGSDIQPGAALSDQEYRESQYNPKTALSKAYWSCVPQSKMLNFDFELTEQEHMVYMKGARDWSDSTVNRRTVTCLADNLGLPTQEIDGYITKSMSEGSPTQTLKYDNYSLIWQVRDAELVFTIRD